MNSASIVHQSHHSHVSTGATPHLKKQGDLYLQRRELDQDFADSSVPFCSVHLN